MPALPLPAVNDFACTRRRTLIHDLAPVMTRSCSRHVALPDALAVPFRAFGRPTDRSAGRGLSLANGECLLSRVSYDFPAHASGLIRAHPPALMLIRFPDPRPRKCHTLVIPARLVPNAHVHAPTANVDVLGNSRRVDSSSALPLSANADWDRAHRELSLQSRRDETRARYPRTVPNAHLHGPAVQCETDRWHLRVAPARQCEYIPEGWEWDSATPTIMELASS
ncbi:hypothetical protein C8R45DRAFT_1094410 [Mycena sanguinolenta]|nr:hypothetical protein C8R45DRAFT_1094410 [Mycena sanguinolenta]